nr:histidine--trna ligase, cytoplasmic [Quercus suber]
MSMEIPDDVRNLLLLLLHSTPSSSTSSSAPITPRYSGSELSKEEASLVEKLYLSSLFGVCAVLDHESAALLAISDAVAALSCKAIKADVAAVEDCPSFQSLLSLLLIWVLFGAVCT